MASKDVETPEILLQPPNSFPFPFDAYAIQVDFMKSLYSTLEDGCFGIFESPTGTGKSLSLICGALKWLEDHKLREERRIQELLTSSECISTKPAAGFAEDVTKDDEPDWIRDFDETKAQKDKVEKLKRTLEAKAMHEARLIRVKKEYLRNKGSIKRKSEDAKITAVNEELRNVDDVKDPDEDIILPEYHSDEDDFKFDKQQSEELDSDSDIEMEDIAGCKIYYCSRTHSQLSQFIHEVIKSPYGNKIHVTSLASRQNMCTNEQVRRLGSVQLINDRCLELKRNKQKAKSDKPPPKKRKQSASPGCPYYKPDLIETFKDLALSEVQDIEQLISLGKEVKACPYYGTRRAVPQADLVVLPYNTLLHAPTRKAVGIRLKGSVVIIDEAHNLLDTICNIHSVEVNGKQIAKAFSQLSQYKQRYKDKLTAKNFMYVTQILQILQCFLQMLKRKPMKEPTEEFKRLYQMNDFLFEAGIDNLNLFKILKYCEKSQISKKLNGFVDKYFESVSSSNVTVRSAALSKGESSQRDNKTTTIGSLATIEDQYQRSSPLMLIESFLNALTNMSADGRICVTLTGEMTNLNFKFLLLNPSVHFEEIVKDSRAVVVAGGTMQPISEFKEQLLYTYGVPDDRIREFSCGHVIPKDNLLALCLSHGPTGVQFDFTFKSRNSEEQMKELGRTVLNICNIIPGGVVCFFPSYKHEETVFSFWMKNGIIESISKKKQIFREPKLSSQLDTVLGQYARCIKCNSENKNGITGALLLSVVGGKMSEGINFSDNLGRCVIMVGLPFPNLKSAELEEKMRYLDRTMKLDEKGRSGGQVHYENLCMKAVNQSIGRAIRHAGDYASVLLIDHRYQKDSIKSKLPHWMAKCLVDAVYFGSAYGCIRKFFKSKEVL